MTGVSYFLSSLLSEVGFRNELTAFVLYFRELSVLNGVGLHFW